MRETTQPTISLIVPTQGRATLERALDSAYPQLAPGDECIVVVDNHRMPIAECAAIVDRVGVYGPRFRAIVHDGGQPSWGHDQINYAMAHAEGDYIHTSDDDDVWLPGALNAMREAAMADPGRVILFRFRSYVDGIVFWLRRGLIREAAIGGHCVLAPNLPGKLGRWGERYAGDFDYITSTLALHDEPPIWDPRLIVEQRPGRRR